MKHWTAIGWALLCLGVAFFTAAKMLVTFTPSPNQSLEQAKTELEGMERAREFWWSDVWIACGMLAVSGVVIAVMACKQQANRRL